MNIKIGICIAAMSAISASALAENNNMDKDCESKSGTARTDCLAHTGNDSGIGNTGRGMGNDNSSSAVQATGNAPTDPQIAAIVVTANQVDIDAGRLAQSETHTKNVKDFAQHMVADHTGVNKAATALVQKLGVNPEDNPIAQGLKQGGDDNVAKLKKLKGSEFDKAYIDHEVAYHEAVLDAIDKTLIPSAKNADLKGLLLQVRPSFQAHLEHAKHLQAQLGKATGSSTTGTGTTGSDSTSSDSTSSGRSGFNSTGSGSTGSGNTGFDSTSSGGAGSGTPGMAGSSSNEADNGTGDGR